MHIPIRLIEKYKSCFKCHSQKIKVRYVLKSKEIIDDKFIRKYKVETICNSCMHEGSYSEEEETNLKD